MKEDDKIVACGTYKRTEMHTKFGDKIWKKGEHSEYLSVERGKGKAAPLQARKGPEGPRKLRFPDFVTTAQDDGKVVSLTHRPPLPPGNTPSTHSC